MVFRTWVIENYNRMYGWSVGVLLKKYPFVSYHTKQDIISAVFEDCLNRNVEVRGDLRFLRGVVSQLLIWKTDAMLKEQKSTRYVPKFPENILSWKEYVDDGRESPPIRNLTKLEEKVLRAKFDGLKRREIVAKFKISNSKFKRIVDKANMPMVKERGKRDYKGILRMKDGVIDKAYPSITEVKNDGFLVGHIYEVCNGKAKSHRGYSWKFASKEVIK